MVDRIFPGSGVNSFLQQNGILKGMGIGSGGMDGDNVGGEIKRLEDVASVTDEEKTELIPPVGTVPVTTKDVVESTQESTQESYTCPCKKCGGEPAKDIKEVWDKFSSTNQKDTFAAGRTPRNVIETIDKAAESFKRTLTGADKKNKNVVEGFCNEHWHSVAISVIIVIAIVFISLSVLTSITVMDMMGKCCKKACCYRPPKSENKSIGLTGGSVF